MTRASRIFCLVFLLPFAAALARDPGGVFQVASDPYRTVAPSAAMDDDGGILVSWVSGESDIEARRYSPAGSPLTGEFEAGEVTATYSGFTAATLDRSGFLVVWGNEPKYTSTYLLGQRFDRENHPLFPDPFDLVGGWDFDVASDPKGNSVLVGMHANGIVATRRNAAGRPVGGVIRIAGNGLHPEVTVDAAGHFVAAWQGEQGIFVRRFSANGSPRGQAVKVTAHVSQPSLAGNRQGQFAMAWMNGSSLWARFYSSSGEPRTQPVLVSNEVGEYTTLSAAMDAEGKVLVTWTCCSDLRISVLNGRWFDRTGAPSGGPFRISSDPQASAPTAASGPKNRFLVVWSGTPLEPNTSAEVMAILGRRLAFARPGDDPCLLRRGSFACDTAHDGGEEELLIPFRGPGSDVPLSGDLDGDGDDDPCRYRPGRFLCDVAHDGGTPELEIAFGQPGDLPLLGDPDGEGRDDACVYRGGQLLCDTAHNGGTAEFIGTFGRAGDLPFLADVDGDGDDDPCVARDGLLLCDTAHDGGAEDLSFPVDFGTQGDVLLLGDVNDDGRADPCVHRGGRFLCDTRRNGSANLIIPFTSRGAIPLLGNLDGL